MPPLLPFMLLLALAPVTYPKDCGFYDVAQNLTVLNDKLFSNVRPVKNSSHTTVVTIDFKLYAIVDLDMKSQVLKTFGWFNIKWKNEYLNWNPNHFCGIQKITVGADSVWKPDLVVTEMTDVDHAPTIQYLYVKHDGTNTRAEPMLIVSTCGLDTYRFPFDTQTCSLTFASFLHPVKEITVKPAADSALTTKKSKAIFESKGDWSLLHIEVVSRNFSYDGQNLSQVTYKITMERTPSHYVVTLIVPACFLVLIDLASMLIPIDGQERLGFKITIVLGFSVLLMILNELLPSSQGTPIIEVFFMVCLILMITNIAGAILISYLVEQPLTRRVPRWIQSCILKHLAKALGINTRAKHDEDGSDDMSITKQISLQTPALLAKEVKSIEAELLKGVLAEMFKIRQAINSPKKGESGSEWYMVAFVLDRFLFVQYLITVITLVCVTAYVWSD